MRAAARYGGAPAWVQPIYECAADFLYRLKTGLMGPDDVPAEWHDLVIAVKAGFAEARSDAAKKGGGGGGARPGPMSEQRQVIEAARARMAERAKQG